MLPGWHGLGLCLSLSQDHRYEGHVDAWEERDQWSVLGAKGVPPRCFFWLSEFEEVWFLWMFFFSWAKYKSYIRSCKYLGGSSTTCHSRNDSWFACLTHFRKTFIETMVPSGCFHFKHQWVRRHVSDLCFLAPFKVLPRNWHFQASFMLLFQRRWSSAPHSNHLNLHWRRRHAGRQDSTPTNWNHPLVGSNRKSDQCSTVQPKYSVFQETFSKSVLDTAWIYTTNQVQQPSASIKFQETKKKSEHGAKNHE